MSGVTGDRLWSRLDFDVVQMPMEEEMVSAAAAAVDAILLFKVLLPGVAASCSAVLPAPHLAVGVTDNICRSALRSAADFVCQDV